jgi:hypothetical protein
MRPLTLFWCYFWLCLQTCRLFLVPKIHVLNHGCPTNLRICNQSFSINHQTTSIRGPPSSSSFPSFLSRTSVVMPGGPDEWLATVRGCQYLPETDLKRLCEMVKELLMEESNIQPVNTPVTICGDVHGQFYDLLELFRVGGDLPDTNYVFMVNCKGYFS